MASAAPSSRSAASRRPAAQSAAPAAKLPAAAAAQLPVSPQEAERKLAAYRQKWHAKRDAARKARADIEAVVAKYDQLERFLRGLATRPTPSYKVPLGRFAFMQGQLVRSDELMISLGENWFVQRNPAEAIALIGRRRVHLAGQIAVVDADLATLQSQLVALGDPAAEAEAAQAAEDGTAPTAPQLDANLDAVNEEGLKYVDIREAVPDDADGAKDAAATARADTTAVTKGADHPTVSKPQPPANAKVDAAADADADRLANDLTTLSIQETTAPTPPPVKPARPTITTPSPPAPKKAMDPALRALLDAYHSDEDADEEGITDPNAIRQSIDAVVRVRQQINRLTPKAVAAAKPSGGPRPPSRPLAIAPATASRITAASTGEPLAPVTDDEIIEQINALSLKENQSRAAASAGARPTASAESAAAEPAVRRSALKKKGGPDATTVAAAAVTTPASRSGITFNTDVETNEGGWRPLKPPAPEPVRPTQGKGKLAPSKAASAFDEGAIMRRTVMERPPAEKRSEPESASAEEATMQRNHAAAARLLAGLPAAGTVDGYRPRTAPRATVASKPPAPAAAARASPSPSPSTAVAPKRAHPFAPSTASPSSPSADEADAAKDRLEDQPGEVRDDDDDEDDDGRDHDDEEAYDDDEGEMESYVQTDDATGEMSLKGYDSYEMSLFADWRDDMDDTDSVEYSDAPINDSDDELELGRDIERAYYAQRATYMAQKPAGTATQDEWQAEAAADGTDPHAAAADGTSRFRRNLLSRATMMSHNAAFVLDAKGLENLKLPAGLDLDHVATAAAAAASDPADAADDDSGSDHADGDDEVGGPWAVVRDEPPLVPVVAPSQPSLSDTVVERRAPTPIATPATRQHATVVATIGAPSARGVGATDDTSVSVSEGTEPTAAEATPRISRFKAARMKK